VDSDLSVAAGHHVAEDVRHALMHGVRRLDTVLVHVDPSSHDGEDHHAELRHHEARQSGEPEPLTPLVGGHAVRGRRCRPGTCPK